MHRERGDAMMAILKSCHSNDIDETCVHVPGALKDVTLPHFYWKHMADLNSWVTCPLYFIAHLRFQACCASTLTHFIARSLLSLSNGLAWTYVCMGPYPLWYPDKVDN